MADSYPLVSVVIITYNHENYIKDAIDGVLLQNYKGKIELIISNDNSPDNSDEIIKKVIEKAPENISVKYTKHESNIGMMPNFVWAINQSSGKYIALCDGDDYWNDPDKLQIQVDFLESNPDFSIICHNAYIRENDKIIEENTYLDKKKVKDVATIEDLAKWNFVATLTCLFRNQEQKFPHWILDSPIGDLPLFLHIARDSKIKYLPQKMAVYRKNVGAWSKMGEARNLMMIKQYDLLCEEYENRPEVLSNLEAVRYPYVKSYLQGLKLSTPKLLNNKYFKTLSFKNRIKLVIKNLLS